MLDPITVKQANIALDKLRILFKEHMLEKHNGVPIDGNMKWVQDFEHLIAGWDCKICDEQWRFRFSTLKVGLIDFAQHVEGGVVRIEDERLV